MIFFMTITILTFIEKNQIDNTCKFKKIRIPKEDIKCIHAGQYTKYCKHYSFKDIIKMFIKNCY